MAWRCCSVITFSTRINKYLHVYFSCAALNCLLLLNENLHDLQLKCLIFWNPNSHTQGPCAKFDICIFVPVAVRYHGDKSSKSKLLWINREFVRLWLLVEINCAPFCQFPSPSSAKLLRVKRLHNWTKKINGEICTLLFHRIKVRFWFVWLERGHRWKRVVIG